MSSLPHCSRCSRRRPWLLAAGLWIGVAAGVRAQAPLASAPAGAPATSLYVAPAGDDAGPGTREAPFHTLQRARDAVRRLNRSATGDIVVFLRGGTYPLDGPVEFGPDDSGCNGHRIAYRAYGDEVPVVSGGTRVTGWTLDHGSIYRATLARDAKLRTLYVDGARAEMAQGSKRVRASGSWGQFVITGAEPWAETAGSTLAGLKFRSAALAVCANPSDVELVQSNAFNELILCVQDMAREGDETVVRLQQPYGAIAASLPWGCGIDSRAEFVVRNAYELLQAPGQFYFNRTTHILYYFSRGEDMSRAVVIAPASEGLIRIAGASNSDRVRNLGFQGITFAYDAWELKELAGSRGFVGVQSLGLYDRYRADGIHHRDHYDCLDLPLATIDLRNCEGIRFERNRFEHLGSGCAISLTNDVLGSTVRGNVFYDLSGNAVNVGHPQHYASGGSPLFPAALAGVCANDAVRDNLIRRPCREFVQEEAITAFFTRGLEISHNDIQGTPYGGIALGWWWGNAEIPASTVPRDNGIAFNRVVDTQEVLGEDGGAIYVLGQQPGGKIIGNYVRGHTRLLYPDDGSSGWTISGNVAEDGKLWFHAWVDRIHDLAVSGNYTNTPEVLNRGVRCPLLETHLEGESPPWSRAAQAIIDHAGLEPEYADLR